MFSMGVFVVLVKLAALLSSIEGKRPGKLNLCKQSFKLFVMKVRVARELILLMMALLTCCKHCPSPAAKS